MVLLYTTLHDPGEAERIAKLLVGNRLAACVNTYPVRSKYRWEGKIEDAEEIVLIIKTSESAYKECLDCLMEEHPYEVPCILRFAAESLVPEYSNWLEKETE